MPTATRFGGVSETRGAWFMLLFLFLGVLVPTACVLWFMNEASRNQAESARQNVREAYRNQLRFVRDRLDEFWTSRATAIEAQAGKAAAADFRRIVAAGLADSVVLLNRDGVPAYPAPIEMPSPDPLMSRSDWRALEMLERQPARLGDAAAGYARMAASETDLSFAARATQGQIRCLVASGDKPAALRVIESQFLSGRFANRGEDMEHRPIAADELLLALHLMKPAGPRYERVAQHLAALLNDYDTTVMPSAQRIFLIGELRSLESGPERYAFPMDAAERLAVEFLDSESPGLRVKQSAVAAGGIPDIWKLTSPGGHVIALYRTATISSVMERLLEDRNTSNVKFAVAPPGNPIPATADAMPAGSMLPAWQVSFSMLGTKPVEEAARRQMAVYAWVGFLVIAATTIAGLLAGQSFRRQLRLTRLKTSLLATVSHELKTPLASMRLLADALLRDAQFDPVKTRDYLELIAGENLRLTRLIENFLTFSRIESNRQKFQFAETNPSDVVSSAVRVMRDRLKASPCRLDVEVSDGLPPIQADEDALVAALLNLLDNAHKYTPGDKQISVRAYRDDGHLILAVKDNGIGIPAREQKRIFRSFYQVDQSLARETGGCGLGLSIVDFIVRAHGGAVEVNSRAGAGSTFSIVLPCDPAMGVRA